MISHSQLIYQLNRKDYKYNENEATTFIQWKGTDVCIDIHCICGYFGHFDGDFFYFCECPQCHRKYALGNRVKLIELNAEQIDFIEKKTCGFRILK